MLVEIQGMHVTSAGLINRKYKTRAKNMQQERP